MSVNVPLAVSPNSPSFSVSFPGPLDALKTFSIVNDFVFRPPKSSYSSQGPRLDTGSQNVIDEIIFIPEFPRRNCPYMSSIIPCRLIVPTRATSRANGALCVSTTFCAIYFHGNACDIGENFLGSILAQKLGLMVLLVEYPGYGMHVGNPSEYSVNRTADRIFQYLLNEKKIPVERIIVFGQSIGSGVASRAVRRLHEYSHRENVPPTEGTPARPAALVLLCPFRSIRRIILPDEDEDAKKLVNNGASPVIGIEQSYTPRASNKPPLLYRIAKYFLLERFDNEKELKNVLCPVLLLHGTCDSVISHTHSVHLHSSLNSENKALVLLEGDGHCLSSRILDPIITFLKKIIVDDSETMTCIFSSQEIDFQRAQGVIKKRTLCLQTFRLLPHCTFFLLIVGFLFAANYQSSVIPLQVWMNVEAFILICMMLLSWFSPSHGLAAFNPSIRYLCLRFLVYFFLFCWFSVGCVLLGIYSSNLRSTQEQLTLIVLCIHIAHVVLALVINH